MSARVLEFKAPQKILELQNSKIKTVLWNLKFRIKSLIGLVLNKIGFPALIGKLEINDLILDVDIKVRIGRNSSIISIGNRDFYFDRLTGKYTGTECSRCY